MKRWTIPAAIALLAIGTLVVVDPRAGLAAWRGVFVALAGVPLGATALLLVARLTGAGWSEPLRPLTRATPWLLPAVIPLIVEQALIPAPGHLRTWLAWPFFAARSLAALGFWAWLARRVAADGMGELGAGLGLVAHGLLLTVIGTDWLLGPSPAQPQSAIAMVLAAEQILAATAAACLLGLGPPAARRDLARLMLAAALGLAYLLFVDFLIVWYGNLPSRIGWYLARERLPWSLIPGAALALGLATPVVLVARSDNDARWAASGAAALAALLLVATWQVTGAVSGWALAPAALLAFGGAALARPWRRA